MAAKSAKDARRQEEKNRAEIEEEKRRRENLFNLRYHQDMTDRTEVQGMLRQEREQMDAARSQNEAKGAVMGDTQEQQIAKQQGLNKAYADSVAGIASNASALKDGYLSEYENSLANYYQQSRAHNSAMSQIEQNRSAQMSQAASNAASAAASGAVAIAGMVDGGPAKAPAVTQQQEIDTKLKGIGDTVKATKIKQAPSWDEIMRARGLGTVRPIAGYPI